MDGYGNSFLFGDRFYSPARADLVVRATAPLQKIFLLVSPNGQSSYCASALAGLREMGRRGGVDRSRR